MQSKYIYSAGQAKGFQKEKANKAGAPGYITFFMLSSTKRKFFYADKYI